MRIFLLAGLLACAVPITLQAQSATPVVTDSRIKTFVYNENDVFSVLTHYGYQSNIEFGKHETVQTVSVGDRVAWQVVPAGRRLFIKALEESAHTNMTVVTNKRAYQFDLRASGRTPLHPSEELVYVVRFFYPDEQSPLPDPALYSDQAPTSVASPVMPVASAAVSPVAASAVSQAGLNYHYTLSGPDSIAPVRIYDDGRATFFTFAQGFNRPVQFYVQGADGTPMPIPVSRTSTGEMVVGTVAPRILVVSGQERVVVYNETMPST